MAQAKLQSGEPALSKIYASRKQKAVLDSDLAPFFGVKTKVFNQAIRRNAAGFRDDFTFQLKREKVVPLKVHGGLPGHPWVFTEYGAITAAMVLRSDYAATMSVYVVRAFVQMREQIASGLSVIRPFSKSTKKLLESDAVLREALKSPTAPQPAARETKVENRLSPR